jgi:hypothetical protein
MSEPVGVVDRDVVPVAPSPSTGALPTAIAALLATEINLDATRNPLHIWFMRKSSMNATQPDRFVKTDAGSENLRRRLDGTWERRIELS